MITSEEADMMQIDALLFMLQQWTMYLYPQSRVIQHYVKSFYLTIWPDNIKTIRFTNRIQRVKWVLYLLYNTKL